MIPTRSFAILLTIMLLGFEPAHAGVTTEARITGLDAPWGLAHLPDGAVLITEKDGRVLIWRDGATREVAGAPQVEDGGQGGLLDITDYLKRWGFTPQKPVKRVYE